MEQKTFINTFQPIQHKMYMLACRLLTSKEEAQDAVQEVMVRLWEKRGALSDVKSTDAYAMQMTKNYALDRLKSKQASHLTIVHSNYDNGRRDAQEEMERNSTVSMVQKVIASLPEQYRIVLELRDIQEFDYEAIEHIMDMKATAVRVTLSRARKMLKEKLEKNYKTEIA